MIDEIGHGDTQRERRIPVFVSCFLKKYGQAGRLMRSSSRVIKVIRLIKVVKSPQRLLRPKVFQRLPCFSSDWATLLDRLANFF